MDVSDLRRIIMAELADVHTCLPGVIVSYDGRSAVVRPALPKQLANGETLAAPQIIAVPVCWPCGDIAGAQAIISTPLRPGDPVKLNFSERGLDAWLSGNDDPPDDPRMFDLSDCFASPMLRPGTFIADTDNVSMQYGPGSIKISPAGGVTIVAPGGYAVLSPTYTHNGVNVGDTHTNGGKTVP